MNHKSRSHIKAGNLLSGTGLGLFLGLLAIPLSNTHAEYWEPDPAFNPALEGSAGVPGGVVIPHAYPGGKVLLTTSYGIINGSNMNGWLVRLNADGQIDTDFGPLQGNGIVLGVYPDGRILYGLRTYEPFARLEVRRALSNGSDDTDFAAVMVESDSAEALLKDDGSIILYGSFITVNGQYHRAMAGLNPDGTLDEHFQSPFNTLNFNPVVHSLEIATDGEQFFVWGNSLNLGPGRSRVARLNGDGSPDENFGVTGLTLSSTPQAVYPNSDGSIFLAESGGNLVRLSTSGVLDPDFHPVLIGSSRQFGPRGNDGKIYYTALVTSFVQLHRLNPDGSDDATFPVLSTSYGVNYGVGLPILNDDGSFLQGPLTAEREAGRIKLTRILDDGTIDPGYNPRFARTASISAHVRQSDGRQLIAGRIDYVNNTPLGEGTQLIRLLEDGSLDPTFTASLPDNSNISRLIVQDDGNILAIGSIQVGPELNAKVQRYTPTGDLDSTYQPITDQVGFMVADAAGRIYGVTLAGTINRYSTDGQLDESYQSPTFDNFITSITPMADGTLLAASTVLSTSTLIRLLPSGAQDPDFTSMSFPSLAAVVALPDGSAVICTGTNTVTNPAYRLRRLRPDQSFDFDHTIPPSSSSRAGFDVGLAIAGVILDLQREAVSGEITSVWVGLPNPLFSMTIESRSDGQIQLANNPSSFDGFIYRYIRTDLTVPSFDARPFIIRSPPATATLWPMNSFFNLVGTAGGLSPMEYQWVKDGMPIPGALTSSLRMGPLQPGDAGEYWLEVSNEYGAVISTSCILTVDVDHSAPVIITGPASQSVVERGSVTFAVEVMANPAPTYQWRFNGANIPGATGSTFSLNDVQVANSGAYSVRVSNTVSNATGNFSTSAISEVATLTVVLPSVITAHPDGQTVPARGTAQFTVVAAYPTAMTYQWYRNGVALANGERISGATGPQLVIGNVGPADAGSYTVLVSNGVGSIQSEEALLTVRLAGGSTDIDGDGHMDILWQNRTTGQVYLWLMESGARVGGVDYGLHAPAWQVAGVGDVDGDGHTDILWQNEETGHVYLWLMEGTVRMGGRDYGFHAPEWQVAGVGDVNGDGHTDILWQNQATGHVFLWLMESGERVGGVDYGFHAPAWKVAGVGDVNPTSATGELRWCNSLIQGSSCPKVGTTPLLREPGSESWAGAAGARSG